MERNIRYTKTSKGGKKLIHDGYMYLKQYKCKDGIRWRCVRHEICTGVIVTTSDDDHAEILRTVGHLHEPDWAECNAVEKVEEIKARALLSNEPASVILDRALLGTPSETYWNLPNRKTLKDAIRRIRRRYRRNNNGRSVHC